MSVMTRVYEELRNNTQLDALLARHKLDPGRPAIYEKWAVEGTEAPYINLTFFNAEGNHFSKVDGSLTINIFDNRTSVEAEAIKRAVVLALDRKSLESEEDAEIRLYYQQDNILDEPGVLHWEVIFSLKYWRLDLIKQL